MLDMKVSWMHQRLLLSCLALGGRKSFKPDFRRNPSSTRRVEDL
jgi:hypothetical protein